MSGVSLSYVNLVSEDIVSLSRFYSDLFDLEELPDFRSEMYVALDLDGVMFGFSPPEVYDLLNIVPWRDGKGATQFMTFEVNSTTTVERLTSLAVEMGAQMLREPYNTSYGSRQAVLADPDGNVFRINYQHG